VVCPAVGGADACVYTEGYAEELEMRENSVIFCLEDMKLEISPLQSP
jgi:hypothetical protein